MKLPNKNIAEWTVFGVSLALVLGVIGFLAFQTPAAANEPARIMVEVGPAERRDGQLIVPVTVSNAGDALAEDIVVEVALERPDAPEMVELSFARLARREMAKGEAVFADGAGSASARVLSYTTP